MKETFRKLFDKYLYKSAYSRAFFTMHGLVLKELRVSFKQFFTWRHPFYSLYRILIAIISSVNRLFLGRSVKYSYAFTGEDRIIEGIYKPLITKTGFYVDVGCNHPIFLSNTYGLYRKGWRGVCIDANSDLIKKYRYLRPRDIAVCSLISDSTEERDFYIVENNVLSTTEIANLQEPDAKDLNFLKTTVRPRTLTSVLNEFHAPANIDILSVDAEEHDLNVLKSLDFNQYTPQLIIVEDETFDINKPGSNQLNIFLAEKGYVLVGYVLKNMYFIKK